MWSHKFYTDWMYRYCVLYLAWRWLNEPKHVTQFLILITNIYCIYWLNKLLYLFVLLRNCRRTSVLPLTQLLHHLFLHSCLIFFSLWIISKSYPTITVRDSSVGIATRYGLDGPGIESWWGTRFPHLSRPTLEPTHPPTQWVPGLSRR
jgi:hypothetical protein